MITRVLPYLIALLSVLTLTAGCDRQTQYSVLTTVFTGVPPMEELYGDTLSEEKATLEGSIEKSEVTLFLHPLWAARKCSVCHTISADEQMNIVEDGNGEPPEASSKKTAMPALLMPANKLCINCHLDKTARRAIRDRLWLHNPVARGDCLSCHSAHQSSNLAHLKQSLDKICAICHDPDKLPRECLAGPTNEQTKNSCLSCHNSHMGRNRFLLTRDYTEAKITAEPVPKPDRSQTAPPYQNK
ncbi:MAG: cytochrome c3 family protein [Desulfocapsa sp.]|nr:cytochrome c3 family protein [Desulfocapsa sp.]